MKILTYISLFCILLVSLPGCGNKVKTEPTSAQEEEKTSQQEPEKVYNPVYKAAIISLEASSTLPDEKQPANDYTDPAPLSRIKK